MRKKLIGLKELLLFSNNKETYLTRLYFFDSQGAIKRIQLNDSTKSSRFLMPWFKLNYFENLINVSSK